MNDLLTAINEETLSVLLLLGLSAAFDTTDLQIFLYRPETCFDIRCRVLHWI